MSDYAVGDSEPDAGFPEFPAQPDQSRVAECQACARDSCGSQRAACLDSEPCRDLLSCHGRCSDPSCIIRCRDTHPESFLFDDYLTCVFGGAYNAPGGPPGLCGGPCGAGATWGCVGVFHWDNSDYRDHGTVTLRFIDDSRGSYGPLSGFQGVEASPCTTVVQAGARGGDQGCSDWKPVDGLGRVTLTRQSINRTDIVALRGDGQAARVYYQEALRVNVPLVNRTAFDLTLSARADYDSRAAIVSFQTFDCLLNLGDRTRVELGPNVPDAVRFYWTGYGLPDSTVATGSIGGFYDVPADPTVKISTYVDGITEPVSSRTVLTAAGWVTSIMLSPRSAEQNL